MWLIHAQDIYLNITLNLSRSLNWEFLVCKRKVPAGVYMFKVNAKYYFNQSNVIKFNEKVMTDIQS